MSNFHRTATLVLTAVVAFALGLFVRSAIPTQAAMAPPQPAVIHAMAKLSGPLQQVVPGAVWIAPLAESANADASVGKIGTVKLHTHKVPNEFIYVVGGSANVQIGSITTVVKAGDFLFIPAGTPHSITAIGSPAEFIAFESPKMPQGDMQYVK